MLTFPVTFFGGDPNTLPEWQTSNASPLASVDVGDPVSITVIATDEDGLPDPISYSLIGSLPTGLSLNGSTGEISGIVTAPTVAPFTIRATDGVAETDRIFQIVVSVVQLGFLINNSLIFNDNDSSVLSRTPSSTTSTTTWTVSCWVKRGNLNSQQNIFSANNGGDPVHTGAFIRLDGALTFQFGGAAGAGLHGELETRAIFRDPASWYHFVFVADVTNATASERLRIYVNGDRITILNTESQPNQNLASGQWNTNTKVHRIGAGPSGTEFLDGYLAEFNAVDGQALDADSFGFFNSRGDWQPLDTSSLTFGTNGFHLDFAVAPGTGNGAGTDTSGNANHFTDNNLTVTDTTVDSPSHSYPVLDPLETNLVTSFITLSDGNLTTSASNGASTVSTFGFSTGKFYFETTVNAIGVSFSMGIGVVNSESTDASQNGANGALNNGWIFSAGDALKFDHSISGTAHGSTATVGNIIQCAIDADNSKIWWGINGTFFNSGDPAAGTNAAFTNLSGLLRPVLSIDNGDNATVNFGQRPFAFTPPTGFSSLNTDNLPTTIANSSDFYNIVTYAGSASNLPIDVGFSPDLIWIKNRTGFTNHILTDTVRGNTKQISTSGGAVEETRTDGIISFDTTGFTVGVNANNNTLGEDFVSWNWRRGSISRFDILDDLKSAGIPKIIPHNLGVKPAMIVSKPRDIAAVGPITGAWDLWHQDLSNENFHLRLNQGVEEVTSGINVFTPTSTNITLPSSLAAATYSVYLWGEIEGFSKFGSYIGNGSSTTGPFVYCGFRPGWLLIKNISQFGGWFLYDNKRNFPTTHLANVINIILQPESTATDNASVNFELDFLSNGFKLRNTIPELNGSGFKYIFAAFAESPFKTARAR